MKKIYDSFLKLLSENNKNKATSIVNDLINGIESSTIIEKHSKSELENNFLIEEKNISLAIFKDLLVFKIKTGFNEQYIFETFLNINKNDTYSLGFNISKKKEENSTFLYLAFNEEKPYSCSIIDRTITSVILNEGNQIIDNNKTKEIINLVLNNFLSPLELKDLLLINCDVDIEQDELLFNIYNHGLILNNNQKNYKQKLFNSL